MGEKNNNPNERDIIRKISKYLHQRPINLLGSDEDAVAILIPDTDIEIMVLNTDGWVQSTDRPHGMSSESVGYRAAVNSLADLVAKGIHPHSIVASITVPANQTEEIEDIVKGIRKVCEEYNLSYLGGDLNKGHDLVVDITCWGFGMQNQLIARSGAKSNDLVCWLGPPLGEVSAALKVLLRELKGDETRAQDIYYQPKLFTDFLGTKASASMDCSDGLASTLASICEQSNVGMNIFTFESSSKFLDEICNKNEISLNQLVLYGGEELGIVFTIDPNAEIPTKALILGSVTSGSGIKMGDRLINEKGWDHFG